MAEYLNNLRRENEVLLVDSGDSFFSAPQLSAAREPQERLRGQLIADSYKEMKLSYIAPGDRDLALGAKTFFELALRSGAKVVSANLKANDPANEILTHDLWEKNGIRVFVTGVVPESTGNVPGLRAEPMEESLDKVLAKARDYQPDYILVLSHLGQSEDEKLAKKQGGLFLLGAHSMDSLSEPQKVENSYLFQPGIEGQQIGEMPLEKNGGLKAHALRDLGKRLDKTNSVKLLMKKYYESLKKIPHQKTTTNKSETSFVGNPFVCKKCHEEQFRFWSETKHSAAILVLYAKNQHYDPQCIGCHTLGYGSLGGFLEMRDSVQAGKENKKSGKRWVDELLEKTFAKDAGGDLDSRQDPNRYKRLHFSYWENLNKMEKDHGLRKVFLGVQCEHCHDNRQAHINRGVRGSNGVRTESCKLCHRPPNAPEFNPETIKQIACPRMVRPPSERE